MWRGYILIAIAALSWGVSATAAKVLFNRNIPPLVLAEVRVAISFLLLTALLGLFGRAELSRGGREWRRLALLGVLGLAGSNVTYYLAIQQSNVPTAILVQYTAPAWVVLYSLWRGVEHFRVRLLVALVLSLGGCAIAVGAYDPSVLRLTARGVAWALGAALTFSFFNIFGGRLSRELGHWTVLYYSFGFATLFWLVAYPPTHLRGYTRWDWTAFALIALGASLIPFGCYYWGLRYLQPTRAIITSTLEPVFAILSSWIVLGQSLSPLRWLGAAGVLAAVLLLQDPGSDSPARR